MPHIPTATRRSSTRRALLSIVLVIGSSLSIANLAPAQSTGFQTDVRFVNNSPFARREWGLATVPFPQGVWTTGRSFRVQGAPSELIPFGQRWPDGSVRFAQLAVRVDVPPMQERSYRVVEGTASSSSFVTAPWLASRIGGFELDVVVGIPGVGVRVVPLAAPTVVHHSSVQHASHHRARIPDTDLVYDLWLTTFSDQDSARFELRLTSARVGSPVYEQHIDWLALVPRNAYAVVRGKWREGLTELPAFDPSGTNPVVLLGATTFFDGQAYDWWGDLVFLDPAVPVPDAVTRLDSLASLFFEPLYGVATNWRSSRAWGPFGYVPEPPPWIVDGGDAAADHDRQLFLQYYLGAGEIWEDRPKGLVKAAATTGAQYDFGVGKLAHIFHGARAELVEEARYVAGEESHRPVHYREDDGSPVRAIDHPQWTALGGRTHWSNSVSPDRLGKPYPGQSPREHTHGWTGKDHEHWSSLTLAAAYMLTASHSLRMELDNEAELYLASHTVPSERPNTFSNNIGNGRALGRTMLTMSWVVLLTGREDVATRMRKRVWESVIPQHDGLMVTGPVRPLFTRGPDARMVSVGDYWVPWEEAQAAMGLEACARVADSLAAHHLAYQITRNVVLYGWRADFDNSLIAYAVQWLPDGSPLPHSWWSDPEHVAFPSSIFFNVWALPATRLAIIYGNIYGDQDLRDRANALLPATEALRLPPRSGFAGWDEYAEWDGVR